MAIRKRVNAQGIAVFLLLLLPFLTAPVAQAAVWYVNAAATAPTPDGSSWATAYPSLQPAADAAAAGDELWVAKGTYTALGAEVANLKAAATLYGGFAGTETARGQRDWKANATIIDGENARRCVTATATSSIDGFTVQHGSAEYGGGMAGGTAVNCLFTGNTVTHLYGDGGGGGLYGGTAMNCIFTGNKAYLYTAKSGVGMPFPGGGGMYGGKATNCVFTGNITDGFGGGLCGGSATSCTFVGNEGWGGGMANGYLHEGTAVNCILWGNTPGEYSGTDVFYSCLPAVWRAGAGNIAADPLLVDPWAGDCRLRGNSPCIDTGGGIGTSGFDILGRPRPHGSGMDMGAYEYYAGDDTQPPRERPVLRVNAASTAAAPDGLTWDTAFPAIQAAADQGGPNVEIWVAKGTYTAASTAVASLRAATFLYGGFAGTETVREQRGMTPEDTVIDGQGGRRCIIASDTSVVDGFAVRNGHTDGPGGGMIRGVASRCVFTGNAADDGGGLSGGTAVNCLFAGNAAVNGGGGMNYGAAIHCTFVGNTTAAPDGGGFYAGTVVNSILSGNSPVDFGGGGGAAGSCVSSSDFGSGYGNIKADPLFVDAAAGDFRLQSGSPCLDTARAQYGVPEDIVGVSRPQGAGYDMGAYERVLVTVPDLTGLARTAAKELIAAAQLYAGQETDEYHPTIPVDHVIRQTPAAGTQVSQWALVDLVISKGPQPVSVPDVVGQPQGAASDVITGLGLAVGAVTQVYSLTVPAGVVMTQSVAPGTLVLPGAAIDLVVSRGGIAVPNVVGQPQGAATTAITNAELLVGNVTQQYSLTVPTGSVISQSVAAGTQVLPGAAVDLVVSKGGIAVPNVVGQAQGAASTAITTAGLVVGSVTQQYSLTVPTGSVISQSVAAGTQVLPGAAVDLVVSKGGIAVPNVVGEAQSAASTAITTAGLAVGNVTQQYSLTVPTGSVISQSVAAGTQVLPGAAVDLVVSKGGIAVPNVVGEAQSAASTAITTAGLAVGSVTQQYSLTVPTGSVISQSVAAGTQVLPGAAIDLVVSKGGIAVPNVVGQAQSAASTAITAAGLVVGNVTQQYSLTVPAGSVISQSVAAGTQVLPGAAIDLVVSKGGIPVPNVVGQPQGAASTAITNAGLVVGTVTQQHSATVPVGSVISQTPTAGTSVLPATAVALVISSGLQEPVMPDLVGQTQAQAEAAVTGAGLTLGLVTQDHSDTVAAGSVISQSPAAGTSLPPGTVVSMVVSLGAAPVAEGEGEPMNADTAREQLAAAYAAADSNGDGTLSFAEAAAAVSGLTQGVFNEIDANGDGQLSANELGVDNSSGCAGCQGNKGLFSPVDTGKRLGDLFLMALGALGLAAMSTLRRP